MTEHIEEVEVISNGEGDNAAEILRKSDNLTPEDCDKLTRAISATSETLWSLLYFANTTKIYQQRGFKTWKEYISESFPISLSTANSLVTQGAVIERISEAAPEGANVHLTQAQARDLKKVLEQVATLVKERTEGKTAEEAEEIIQEIVAETREQVKADKEALQAQKEAEKQQKLEEQQQRYEDAATEIIRQAEEQYAPATEEYAIEGAEGTETYEYTFDDEEDEEPTSEVNRKAVTLRNLYTVIGKSESMPPVEEALEVIPQERVSKTHTELSELEQKAHDIRVALEECYGNSILRNTMSR